LVKVEEESITESQIPDMHKKSLIFTAIMLLLGIFAPILISVFNYSWQPTVIIQGLLWIYQQSPGWYSNGFSIIDSYIMMSMFPFLLLRIVPVLQIYRYYNGKTTRNRVFITAVLGDGYTTFSGIFLLFLTIGSDTYHIPLPFQIIFAFFILLTFRFPEPTAPWKGKEEPKSWWEKEPDSQQEKKEAEDELW